MMLWGARQLLGKIEFIINECVQAHPRCPRIFQHNVQSWLTMVPLIVRYIGPREFLIKSQMPEHLVLSKAESFADLNKFFRKTFLPWSSTLPHQKMPPDGTNIMIPDLPLAAIAARMPSRFAIAGSLNLLCSAATPITLDVKRLRALAVANDY
jgi:hypothetical protein